MLLPALLTLDAHLVIAPRCEVLAFWQGSNRNVAPAGGAREYDHHAHDALRFFFAVSAENVPRLCEFHAGPKPKLVLGFAWGVHLSLETVANGSDPAADALKAISVPGGDHSQSTAH